MPPQSLQLAVSFALTNVRADVGSPVDVHAWVNAPSALRMPGYGVATTDAFPMAPPSSPVRVRIPLQPGTDTNVSEDTRSIVTKEFGGALVGISVYVTTNSGEPVSAPSGTKIPTARTRFPMGTALMFVSDLRIAAITGDPVETLIMDSSARLSRGGASNPVSYPIGVLQVRVVGSPGTLPAVLESLPEQRIDPAKAIRAHVASAARMTMADFQTLMQTYTPEPASIAPTQSLYNTSVLYSLPASTYCIRGVRECGSGGAETMREAAFLRQQLTVACAEYGMSESQFARAASGKLGPLRLTLATQIVVRASTLYVLSLPYVSERASYSRTQSRGATAISGAAPASLSWVSKDSIDALTRSAREQGRMSSLRDYFDPNLSASGEPDCEDGARWAHDVLWVMHSAGRVVGASMGSAIERSATPLQRLIASGGAGDALRTACQMLYATSVPAIGFYAASSASASGSVAADVGGRSYASHQAVELHSVPSFVAMLPSGTAERYPGITAALDRAHRYPGVGSRTQPPPYSILHGETTGSAAENFAPVSLLPHESDEAATKHLRAFVDEGRFVRAIATSSARDLLDMNIHGPPNMRDARTKHDIVVAEDTHGLTLSSFKIKTTSLMTPWVRETTGRHDASAKFDFVTVHVDSSTGAKPSDDNVSRERLVFDQKTATFGASVASTVMSGLRGDALPFAVKLLAHDGMAGPEEDDALGVLPAGVCALTVADPPSMLPRLDTAEVGMSGVPPSTSTLRPLYDALLEFDTTRGVPAPDTPLRTPVPMESPYRGGGARGRLLLWCSERAPPDTQKVQRALASARSSIPALTGIQVAYAPLVSRDVRVGASGGLSLLCLTLQFDPRRLPT